MSALAQNQDQNNDLYRSKIESYTKLKNTGTIMAATGACLTVGGIILVSNADWSTTEDIYGNTTLNTVDGKGLLGVTGIIVGIPLGVTGIVLNSIGKRKVKYYRDKLENVNLGYFQYGQQKGITVAIKF